MNVTINTPEPVEATYDITGLTREEVRHIQFALYLGKNPGAFTSFNEEKEEYSRLYDEIYSVTSIG